MLGSKFECGLAKASRFTSGGIFWKPRLAGTPPPPPRAEQQGSSSGGALSWRQRSPGTTRIHGKAGGCAFPSPRPSLSFLSKEHLPQGAWQAVPLPGLSALPPLFHNRGVCGTCENGGQPAVPAPPWLHCLCFQTAAPSALPGLGPGVWKPTASF